MTARLTPLATAGLCAAAGALNLLSFAPFGFWPLQIGTLAILIFFAIRAPSVKLATLLGWAYGTAWTIGGIYWLYISMHRYGGMPSWMAALAVFLLGAFLGSSTALAMGSASWISRRFSMTPAVALLLVFPATWALFDWSRDWIFTGFPWVASGYAHTASPLAGYAPVVGVYGISVLAAMVAGCVVLLEKAKWAVAVGAAIFAVGFGLQSLDWTEANGQPISVRLLQGNVPQDLKFDAAQTDKTLAMYQAMIREKPADLIATPETALPMLANNLPPGYIESLMDFSRLSKSHIVVGVPISDSPKDYSNSVIGLSPNLSAKLYRYDKHHLVPFGEFIPLGFRWFVNMMNIPLGDFKRGNVIQQPFAVGDQWVLPNICYEDLFGEEIAAQIDAGYRSGAAQPTVLLNTSNIAWFGDSTALPQHLQASQMRSLETRRPMLRATNTGATAVIDQHGRIVAQLAPYTRGTLSASVQGYRGWTPFILAGNASFIIAAVLMLFSAWLLSRKNSTNSPSQAENR